MSLLTVPCCSCLGGNIAANFSNVDMISGSSWYLVMFIGLVLQSMTAC